MKQKILIIDDSEDIIEIACEILHSEKTIIETANNGNKGIIKANEIIPDLILLDIMMPGIDGFEVCKILKNNQLTKNIPIILMSALVDNEHIIKGLKLGAVDYIKKPFNIDELQLRINIHLELIKPKKELEKQTAIRIQTEKELQKIETRFRNLFLSVPVGLYLLNKYGEIIEANPSLVEMLNYPSRVSLLNTNVKDIFVNNRKHENIVNLLKSNRTVKNYIAKLYRHNEGVISTINSIRVVYNKKNRFYEGSIIDITENEEKIKALEKAHKDIITNINYAKSIQNALLTSKKKIDSYFNNYFLFFKPKKIVSGDFYYINKIKDNIVFAVADCTGHGVTGGFLTVIGITYLHEIVRSKSIIPSIVLNSLRQRFKNIFRTFGTENKSGLDIAYCTINTKNNILEYSGANNPIYIIRNNNLLEFKANRNPIGFYYIETDFKSQQIQLQNNDLIYLFSDGFADQLNEAERKFTKKRFRELLLEINTFSLKKQGVILEKEFKKWKGNFEQIDDVTVLGIKWQY